MSGEQAVNFWHLADELSVVQAALAIVGDNPGDEAAKANENFPAVLTAMIHAIEGGRLPAKKVYEGRSEVDFITGDVEWHPIGSIDADLTRVMVDDLRNWLSARGMAPVFFVLDQNRYPPKLAAAVFAHDACRAALAYGDDLQGKTPMEWMEDFLLARKTELGITPTGAKEAAAISNWRGPGAPKKAHGA